MGFGPSGALSDSPGGFGGGPVTVGTVVPGSNGIATLDWHPTVGDLIDPTDPNSADLCLTANCFTETDAVPEGSRLTAASNAFSAAADQHQGQTNIQLRRTTAGGRMRFWFNVANAEREEARFNITVEELSGEDGFGLLGREHVLSGRGATVTGLDPIEIARLRTRETCGTLGQPIERALLAAGGLPVLVDSAGSYEVCPAESAAERLALVSDALPHGGEGCEHEITVKPGVLVPVAVDVKIADDTPAGGAHVFDAKQYDQDGVLVGGIRFFALAVTDELLDPCRVNDR